MEDSYVTLQGSGEYTTVVKRSEFIGYCAHVTDKKAAEEFILKIKSKHYDAKHNVYAYILRDGTLKYSDDGEPQGTAGMPVLSVIQKEKVVDIVVVVTRYFGGILLGGGGLVRAYSDAASGAINASPLLTMIHCTEFKTTVDYSKYGTLNRYCDTHQIKIIDTTFEDNVTVTMRCKSGELDGHTATLFDTFGGEFEHTVTAQGYYPDEF